MFSRTSSTLTERDMICKLPKRLLAGIFIFISVFSALAKDGDEHEKDQLRVLGLWNDSKGSEWFGKKKNKKNREIMRPLLVLYNDMIDDPSDNKNEDVHQSAFYKKYFRKGEDREFYSRIKEKFPGFSWGKYTHRLFYHWGFEYGDPANQDKLRIQFYKKLPDATEEEWNAFLTLIQEEQGKRNKKTINATDEFFGLAGDKTFARGIAGICYYTHLLGDHVVHAEKSSESAEAVLSSKFIAKNIDRYVKDLATHGNQKEFQRYKEYHDKVNSTVFENDEQYAQAMIDMLVEYVPQLLKRNLPETFKNLNLEFVK